MYSSHSDEELILKIANQDQKAFDEIYARYASPIYNYLNRLIFDSVVVEDVFQEVFTKVYINAYQFKPNHKFSPWIYRIATNTYYDYYKSIKTKTPIYTTELINETADSSNTPLNKILKDEELELLKRAIHTLPEKIKQVFVLKIYQNCTFKEIARIVGVSVRTTKNYMEQAKEHIRQYFEGLR